MDADTLAILILSATAVGTLGYGVWRDARCRRRLAAGQCVRCGESDLKPVDLTRTEPHSQVALLMCAPCATRTRRHHRLAYWMYLALCGLGFAAMVLGVSGDLRRGAHYSLSDYWWLGGLLLFPLKLLPVFRRGMDRGDD